VTQRLASARRLWSEFVESETGKIESDRTEVMELLSQLAMQHEKLGEQKTEFRGWLDRRYRDVEEQAARLIVRERELNMQEATLKKGEKQWLTERKDAQRQMLDLRTKVNKLERVA